MITAKQVIEAYLTRLPLTRRRGRGGTFEVFENPILKELQSADSTKLGVRFTAHLLTETVYVWDLDAAIHSDVEIALDIKNKGKRVGYGWSNLLIGVAEQQGSRYKMVHSDLFYSLAYYQKQSDIESALNMLDQDWSWVDRYIIVTPYLEEVKEKLLKIKR